MSLTNSSSDLVAITKGSDIKGAVKFIEFLLEGTSIATGKISHFRFLIFCSDSDHFLVGTNIKGVLIFSDIILVISAPTPL